MKNNKILDYIGILDKKIENFLNIIRFHSQSIQKLAEVHFQAGLVPQNASKEEFAQALRVFW